MRITDIVDTLETTGYPVAYQKFDTPQDPPFLCVSEPFTNNFFADGKVQAKTQHVQIDLIERFKSAEVEDNVEKALSAYAWQKEMEYDDAEDVYRVIYEVEVILDGES